MNFVRFFIGIAVVIAGFVVMDAHRIAHHEEYYSTAMVVVGACLSIIAINRSRRLARFDQNFNRNFRGGLEATFNRRREEEEVASRLASRRES